MKQVFI